MLEASPTRSTALVPINRHNTEIVALDTHQRARELAAFFRELSRAGLVGTAVAEATNRFGISRATLFRRYDLFVARPRISTLITHRKPRLSVRGTSADQDTVIENIRKRFFKQYPKGSIKRLCEATQGALAAEGLPVVSEATIRRRWQEVPYSERLAVRQGARAAREKGLLRGHTPERTFPLERIQIDHTLCDIELVHPVTGEPIGRPWITIALDEYSRTCLAFVLSFEAPSATTVALTMVRAVSSKDQWLRDLKITAPWPFAGLPHSIYTDNGSDFCSKAMADGCAEWGIPAPEKRPKGSPQYGGIIERIIGTVMKETAMLPGAIARRVGTGRDEPKAPPSTFTIDDYERHLAEWFCHYHQRKHSTLDMSPARKWEEAFSGRGKRAIPAPRMVEDTRKLFIDFLPSTTRGLKRYGFSWDSIYYRSDNLAFFQNRSEDERYVIRRNPLDIRRIYVWHPDLKQHLEIMAEDPTIPPTLFYLRMAKAWNAAHEVEQDNHTIARTYNALLEMEKNRPTRKGRKSAQRNDERDRRAEQLTNQALGEQPAPEQIQSAPEMLLLQAPAFKRTPMSIERP